MPQGPSGAGTLYGRFGYTGQAWLPELGLYYYKARMMDPKLGRFMQTDPARDRTNLYAYPTDPINFADPTGMTWWASRIELKRNDAGVSWGSSSGGSGGGGLLDSGGNVRVGIANDIYWERADGSGGSWGGEAWGGVVASGGNFYGANSGNGTAQEGINFDGMFQFAGASSPSSWTDVDFVEHYYLGGGKPIDLGDVGLGATFRNHPSVASAVNSFIGYVSSRPERVFRFRDTTETNVTDTIFSVGGSTFFRDGMCGNGFCAFSFGIRDWFRDPVSLGVELGGTPYRINYHWNVYRRRGK